MAGEGEADELGGLVGQLVVLDTSTPIIYIGTLEGVSAGFITLRDADVHDVSEGGSGKEMYAIEARKYGVKKNRSCVKIRVSAVISVSRLEDVIEY